MAWKLRYRCKDCGYEAEMYEGRGLFRQQITAMSCPDCKTIQNIVVGGIIADVAPSYRSEVGRLCLQCGSDNLDIIPTKELCYTPRPLSKNLFPIYDIYPLSIRPAIQTLTTKIITLIILH